MLYRLVIVALGLGLTTAARAQDAATAEPPAPPQRPNVVFLISDDLGAQALGCYGATQCKTPNIDRLAARGVRFTRAYCQFPVCGPARAALMSGLYPQAAGVMGNGQATRLEQNLGDRPTLPQHFMQHGYHTARISKVFHMRVPGDITAGVDGPDHLPSWHERHNCQGPEWMTEGKHQHPSNERLLRRPEKHYGLGFGSAFYIVRGSSDGAEQPDLIAADKAIELIKTRRDKPLFLAVGFVRPHVPLVAPASFYKPYPVMSIKPVETRDGDWDDIPARGISGYNSKARGLTSDLRKKQVLAAYYASVAFMDAQVGRILDALDEQGLTDNTILVFTSDHGYHLGEHDFWQKMSLHEESARVPLIIAAPGKTPATATTLAQHIDLYPTLADLAGLPQPEHVQGKSLVPALDDPAVAIHDAAYCVRGGAHLLRTDRWAFIQYPNGDIELYDMHRDPKQFDNLAGRKPHQQTIADFKRQLAERVERLDAARPAQN